MKGFRVSAHAAQRTLLLPAPAAAKGEGLMHGWRNDRGGGWPEIRIQILISDVSGSTAVFAEPRPLASATSCPEVISATRSRLEGWQNGYCTGLENRRPKGLVGSNPTPSVPYPEGPATVTGWDLRS